MWTQLQRYIGALALGAASLAGSATGGCRPIDAEQARIAREGRVALGAHALVGQEDTKADPVATATLDTAAQGSSFVAFVAGFASNDAPPEDSHRNAWRLLGTPVPYRGYDGRFDVRPYLALDGRGGSGHGFRVDKPGEPAGELTLVVVEARNAGRLVDVARNYPGPGVRLASGTVTTDGPALLVAFWWGDARGLRHVAIPGDGFRRIEEFTRLPPNSAVQAAVAVRRVEQAGRYRVTWNTLPAQGAMLWLFAFAAADAQPPAGSSHSKAAPSTKR